MKRGNVYRHIRLVDPHGQTVERAFLELEPELWDPEARRLTLLFDPGRIKRGLRPRLDLGPALKEGGTYTLVVEEHLENANGVPLLRGLTHRFQVGRPDRTSPDPDRWSVESPEAGSREAVMVRIDEQVDRALLRRLLTIVDDRGETITGYAEVSQGAREWMFVPDTEWKSGEYAVRADVRLEDRAGNRLDGLFDQDLEDAGSKWFGPVVDIPFTIE